MYEHNTQPLLPKRKFYRRVARHGMFAAWVLLVSLGIGTIGFHVFNLQSWLDAFLNASMLLGGMGPVGNFGPPAAKIFAAFYALYSGVVFLGAGAVLLAPIVHRVLHKFHLDEAAADAVSRPPRSR